MAYYNRGNVYRYKGDNDRAIADYNEAIGLDPKYAMAYDARGNAYTAKGDNDRAIADFSEAIQLDPKYAPAYDARGNAYTAKGENDRAITDYNEAIRLDPKFAVAFNNRGTAYLAKGENDRAIADYNEAIRLDFALAFANRGNAYRLKGEYDRAIADFSEAIRLHPKFAHPFHNRGNVFFYNGDFEKAAADLLSVNDLKDDAYAMLWRYLALGHMGQDGAAELSVNATRLKSKDWPQAVIDFYLGRRSLDEMRTATGNGNDRCQSEFYAGEWQFLRGNKAEAKESLQIAADTCPRFSVEYHGAISELRRLDRRQ
jgi:tetratricopeptide (TPR) repeat protein